MTFIQSPDKKYCLCFFDNSEPHMGLSVCKFSLTNKNKVVYNFPQILVLDNRLDDSCWSKNSRYFLLKTWMPFDSIFIFDTQNKKFAILKFTNIFVLNISLESEKLKVDYYDDQMPDKNGNHKYPTKEFIKPSPLFFNYETLIWHEFEKILNYTEFENNTEIHSIELIDNGWMKFKGSFPQSTDIIIQRLKEFAKYGDIQSIEWLKEIISKNAEPDDWTNASDYIGQKQRK